MLKIDLENHFYDGSVIRALELRKKPPFYDRESDQIQWTDSVRMPQGILLERLLDVGENRIKLMDAEGIDKAVLSCSPGPEQLDIEESISVCKNTNDALAAVIKKYPDRFYGSAILPVHDVDAACKELERCVKELGFVAWHTHSNYGMDAPDQETYRPIFKKAADLGIYVYLHPQLPEGGRMEDFGFTFAGPGLGFTVDTVTTIMRMIVSGLFDEIPGLKVVLGHLGEGLPFLLDRIDNRISFLPNPNIKCRHDVSYYFKNNIWVTTSGNMSPEAFACAKKVLGMDHILFGSDYPYENVHDMMEFLKGIPLNVRENEQLYYDNANNILNIPLYGISADL